VVIWHGIHDYFAIVVKAIKHPLPFGTHIMLKKSLFWHCDVYKTKNYKTRLAFNELKISNKHKKLSIAIMI